MTAASCPCGNGQAHGSLTVHLYECGVPAILAASISRKILAGEPLRPHEVEAYLRATQVSGVRA